MALAFPNQYVTLDNVIYVYGIIIASKDCKGKMSLWIAVFSVCVSLCQLCVWFQGCGEQFWVLLLKICLDPHNTVLKGPHDCWTHVTSENVHYGCLLLFSIIAHFQNWHVALSYSCCYLLTIGSTLVYFSKTAKKMST